MTRRTALFASVTFIALASLAAAQTMPKPAAQESGITAYLQFGGTTNSDGQVYALNPSVGYDFNSHFGMAVGAPVYFVRPSSSTGSASATGLGDPFLGLHLRYPNEILNFATFLTGTAPVGNSKEGLSTAGRPPPCCANADAQYRVTAIARTNIVSLLHLVSSKLHFRRTQF